MTNNPTHKIVNEWQQMFVSRVLWGNWERALWGRSPTQQISTFQKCSTRFDMIQYVRKVINGNQSN